MIDNTAKKESTRFVVVREFNGSQSMVDVFGALVERQANDNYERWKSDHGDSPGQHLAGNDRVTDGATVIKECDAARKSHNTPIPDNVEASMNILTPMPRETDQTA